MDDKELEFVKRCMSIFIDRKIDELNEAKEGKKLEIDDVESLSEQIKKFVREHFGDVPEAFCRKLKDVHDEVYHALMENKQPPFRTGGVVCPDLFSSLSSLISSFFISTDKVIIKALFKKIVEEQLDEMWPEYKDRWKD